MHRHIEYKPNSLHMVLKPQHDQLTSTGRRIIELLISTGWLIDRVVDFNTLQVVDFNRMRLNMSILLTTQGRPRSGRPCFCPLHWHVQPQPVEINNLQRVEMSKSMNGPTCFNQQLDQCGELLKSTGRVGVLKTM